MIAACAVLDEWGVPVPDTLAVASFAWGLGHMLSGGAASALADWDNRTEWQSAGVFAVAAEMLEPRSPREWLRLDQLASAQ